MKLYSDTGDVNLKEVGCVGISATPEVLRAIAKFINYSADQLEEMGNEFSHLHLMDAWSDWKDGMPDIQIFNGKM